MQAFIQLYLAVFTLLWSDNSAIDHQDVKLAANDHLLVFHRTVSYSSNTSTHYQCLAYRDKVFHADSDLKPVYSVAIGRAQTQAQLYFVLSGITNESIPFMSKITVACNNGTSEVQMKETVFFEKHLMTDLVVGVDPHGRYAVGFISTSLLFYDLTNLQHLSLNITWPHSTRFFPLAIDISNYFIYIIGYSATDIIDEEEEKTESEEVVNSKINLRTHIYVLSVENQHQIKFYDSWLSDQFMINPIMKLCIRANDDDEQIVVGIPTVNTVHLFIANKTSARLYYVSSRTKYKPSSVSGYGWDVEWLNEGRKVLILDVKYSGGVLHAAGSNLEYYEMNNNNHFNNETVPFASFPNDQQGYPQNFKKPLSLIAATTSTLYGMSEAEHILILLPSGPGFYSVDFLSHATFALHNGLFFFVPNSAQCQNGTYKNDSGIWPCNRCQIDAINDSSVQYMNSNVSTTCPQCTNKLFCPLEFATDVQQLIDVDQYTGYPETPEIDVFDSILMRNMFRTDCLLRSPLIFTLILLGIVLFLSIIISMMKSCKRFALKQHYLTIFLRHLDFIEQGQLWFGGLISIVLLVLLGFAITFSYVYHNRYPIENQHFLGGDSCLSRHHLNAKFETNLQFLRSPPGQLEQIFHLLDAQEFTLNIELIKTKLHCGRLTLNYERLHHSLPFSCYTNDLILYASAKLSTHYFNLILELTGDETVDAIRIGLTGSDTRQMNNYVQKLNFAKLFNYTDRVLGHERELFINLQLTKVINITEGLTDSDETTYSGIWLPTFNYDIDQLFIKPDPFPHRSHTRLILDMSETSFFIQNKQKPIARSSEIIFSTILFICVCLDLLCMIFLLLRLWFRPMIKLLVSKLCSPNSWIYQLMQSNMKCTSEDTLELTNKITYLQNVMQQQIDTLSTKMNLLAREHTIEV